MQKCQADRTGSSQEEEGSAGGAKISYYFKTFYHLKKYHFHNWEVDLPLSTGCVDFHSRIYSEKLLCISVIQVYLL